MAHFMTLKAAHFSFAALQNTWQTVFSQEDGEKKKSQNGLKKQYNTCFY